MADVVKALVLVVETATAGVRVPGVAATKNGRWDDPLHRRCPNNPARA